MSQSRVTTAFSENIPSGLWKTHNTCFKCFRLTDQRNELIPRFVTNAWYLVLVSNRSRILHVVGNHDRGFLDYYILDFLVSLCRFSASLFNVSTRPVSVPLCWNLYCIIASRPERRQSTTTVFVIFVLFARNDRHSCVIASKSPIQIRRIRYRSRSRQLPAFAIISPSLI